MAVKPPVPEVPAPVWRNFKELQEFEGYIAQVSRDLAAFAKDTPVSDLRVESDTGDGIMYARAHGYRCTQSVYGDEEEKNTGRIGKDLDPWYEGADPV